MYLFALDCFLIFSHQTCQLYTSSLRIISVFFLLPTSHHTHQEEQFEHLGKVARMPAAYTAFLQEVLRQRRYHQVREERRRTDSTDPRGPTDLRW